MLRGLKGVKLQSNSIAAESGDCIFIRQSESERKMQLSKQKPKFFRNKMMLAFFLMSLLLVTSAGCDAGATTDCSLDTFLVTTSEDINDGQCTAGHCSLREAIIAANSCSVPGGRSLYTILLGRGTFTLTLRGPGDDRGDLNINNGMQVSGEGAGLTIIQGGDSWNDRIFSIGEGIIAEIGHLSIQGGNSSADGGAILNQGSIELDNVKLSNNSADGDGGAVFSTGTATLRSVEVTGNSTDRFGSGCGGGLHNLGTLWIFNSLIERNNSIDGHGICSEVAGHLEINDSRILNNGNEAFISNNAGGGIFIASSDFTFINDTTIQGNRAASGGGLYASNEANLVRLDGVTVADNIAVRVRDRSGEYVNGAGGGLYLSAEQFIILDSLIIDNIAEEVGGGIYAASFDESLDRIEHSAIARNAADRGGGIYFGAGATLVRNVTISSNDAGSGAAIYNSVGVGQAITLIHATLADNGSGPAGGTRSEVLYQRIGSSSWFTIGHTLIVDNGNPDCFGLPENFRSAGFNYGEAASCNLRLSSDLSGTPADIALSGLSEIDGTLIHLLPPWSSAVDFIPASEPNCIEDDQLHEVRPEGDRCDIGAYELRAGTMSDEGAEVPIIPTPAASSEPTATALTNASCRKGADPAHEVHNFLFEGQSALVVGRLSAVTWVYVELPDELGRCWIFSENLDLTGPVDSLPLFTSPELPQPDEGGDDAGSDDGAGDGGGGNDGGGNDGGGNDAGGGGGSAPAAPSNGSISNRTCDSEDYFFTIVWHDNASNENGFRILRDGVLIATLGANVESYMYTPPGSGPYTFTIEAFNDNGTGSTTVEEAICFV
jgi:CSLREA domain-containing protein